MRAINYTLTSVKLNAAKGGEKAYKLTDGGGLFVRVSAAGTKTWCYGYSFADKRKEVTFGQYPEVSIKEARDRHFAARQQIAQGIDPTAAKREEKEAVRLAAEADENVFKVFAERWIGDMLSDASADYRSKVRQRLANHAYPYIGKKRLEAIKPRDILPIVEKLRNAPAMSEKVRGLIKSIFDHAIRKLIVETNPAEAMKGLVKLPAPTHHAHLDEAGLGEFWRALAKDNVAGVDPSTVACTRFIALTLCRKSEALAARWSEIDMDEGTWTITAERMKMRREHRVYLPRQAMAILKAQHELTGGKEFVFGAIGRTNDAPLTSTPVINLFKRLEGVPKDFTPHGLRATGATILREHGFRRDVVELLLAHVETGVAAIYHRHELADERREALQHYADTIDSLAAGGKVVGLRSKRRAA
ncbi:integrase arm-type DNA-binding domain-containing protein [Burkholderia seminalis]|uniref:tyrosine-type recombinase/integrase n=1 Tax=Burkholderia seminalis TaxID=488731 RepID=UPI001CF581B2|nr:integrase arm-type DNA-binding domain-containing protein [Burkholderia seminalis]MCA8304192.1 integrase arm-type DNA-binding domain-containing protein [Burkholderia seminalis]